MYTAAVIPGSPAWIIRNYFLYGVQLFSAGVRGETASKPIYTPRIGAATLLK
jgi:hypothetical protein